MLKSVLFGLSLLTIVLAQVTRYDGHKVLRVTVENESQLQALQKVTDSLYLDIWSRDSALGIGANDIRVSSIEEESLIRALVPTTTTLITDVQKLIDDQTVTKPYNQTWFTSYHRYSEIVAFTQELAGKYPNIATFIPSIGKTVEGRDIPAIQITGSKDPSPKRIWFQGGQHAREWIGPATVMYIINEMLTKYGTDDKVTQMVNSVEFTIVPLINADGYEFSQTSTRLWRKNRKRNSDGSYGVDLNRNWNDHWGGEGSSPDPRSDVYHGTGPFSEPESKAASNYLDSIIPNVLAAIDFHSYSQLVLRPYGWTRTNCPDEKALKALGDGVRDAIYLVHQKTYVSQRAIDLYVTTGSAGDWFYQEGIWGAYTIELRDTGQYGFILPPSQIIPTGQEIWSSMLYFVETVLKNHPTL
jgi:murein tripeptide amidase MpaA